MKKTYTILTILVLTGGIVAYSYFGNVEQTKSAPLSSTNTGIIDTQENVSANVSNQFLRLLLSVNSITISNELFAKPTFLALKDFSTRLESDGSEGRPNPFAQLGTDQDLSGGTVVNNNGTTNTSGVQSPITTGPAATITTATAIVQGALAQGATATERFFEYGVMTAPPFDKKTQMLQINPATGVFGTVISGLTPNTTYSYRGVAKIGGQYIYGQVLTFKTLPSGN